VKDFKVYVPVKDEECLIAHTIDALKQVFDPGLIEVLDLESEDSTVSRVPADVKVTEVSLQEYIRKDATLTGNGAAYTKMKNEYSQKQKWVLWVDGDEIYPIRTSLGIVEWLKQAREGNAERRAKRLYWRILKEEGGRKYQSVEFLNAGGKVFDSEYLGFNRAWPKEVFRSLKGPLHQLRARHSKDFNGLWFWHGVLLKRSAGHEPAWRRKKREGKVTRYNSFMTWKEIDKWPWETGYESEIITDWTVIRPHPHSSQLNVWKGRF